MAFPDGWEETALISISRIAGSDVEFAAITETIDIDEGEAPGESIATISGGRIWKDGARQDGTITLEIYPIELSEATGVGLFQQFTGGTIDSSEPLETDTDWPDGVSRVKDKFRVAILWTNDPAATEGRGSTAASTDALRFYATDCRLITHTASFTDGILKITATFKFPAFSKNGNTAIGVWQSGNQTALVTLGSYT